jgi:hypothetical protein
VLSEISLPSHRSKCLKKPSNISENFLNAAKSITCKNQKKPIYLLKWRSILMMELSFAHTKSVYGGLLVR